MAGLLAVAVLLLVLRHVLGGFAVALLMPPFDPAKAPPPPDYALADNWAALPTKDDASDRRPAGLQEAESPTRDLVDVFYIHPTGYNGRDNWNGTPSEANHYDIPTSLMLAVQASAFNGCGQVYAPEYRQATLAAYLQPLIAPQRMEGFQALDLAYEDVARAFDYFIEHYSHGRPYIVASHSQGTHHLVRLLAEKIDGTPLYDRMIAAYAIGGSVPRDYLTCVYKRIQPCTSPTQTGCLIAWDTIREGAWVPSLGFHRYPTGWEFDNDKPIYCVNPLTWSSTEERAPATANGGALLASMVPFRVNPDACVLKGLLHQHTWAECHGGRVWVADQKGTAFYDRFGVYHLFDYSLFWVNIRENARLRAETYLREHGQLTVAKSQSDSPAP